MAQFFHFEFHHYIFSSTHVQRAALSQESVQERYQETYFWYKQTSQMTNLFRKLTNGFAKPTLDCTALQDVSTQFSLLFCTKGQTCFALSACFSSFVLSHIAISSNFFFIHFILGCCQLLKGTRLKHTVQFICSTNLC